MPALKDYTRRSVDALKDEDLKIVQAAIQAAGLTVNPQFIPAIIPFLSDKSTRGATQTALLNFGPGIVDKMRELIDTGSLEFKILRGIPGVLEHVGTQQSVNLLLTFLSNPDPKLRLEALKSLNTLHKRFPFLVINNKQVVHFIIDEANLYKNILALLYTQSHSELNQASSVSQVRQELIKLLEDRLDGTLERIFRLLGLCYPPDDVIPAYEGIRNKNPDIRTNSVEFLENLLEPNLKKTLIPIAESALLESISDEAIKVLKVKVPSERECYVSLLQGGDVRIRIVTLQLIGALGDGSYKSTVKPLISDPDERIRMTAKATMDQIR